MVSTAACYRESPGFKSRQGREFINFRLKRKFNNSNLKYHHSVGLWTIWTSITQESNSSTLDKHPTPFPAPPHSPTTTITTSYLIKPVLSAPDTIRSYHKHMVGKVWYCCCVKDTLFISSLLILFYCGGCGGGGHSFPFQGDTWYQ